MYKTPTRHNIKWQAREDEGKYLHPLLKMAILEFSYFLEKLNILAKFDVRMYPKTRFLLYHANRKLLLIFCLFISVGLKHLPVNVPSRSSNTASCSHLKAAIFDEFINCIFSNLVLKPPPRSLQNEHARRAAHDRASKFTNVVPETVRRED